MHTVINPAATSVRRRKGRAKISAKRGGAVCRCFWLSQRWGSRTLRRM
jgi:hypothetical protein